MMKLRTRSDRGFSLLEVIVTIGIAFTLMGVLVMKSFGSMESYRANSAMDVVVTQMRVARGLAISQRRTVFLWVDQNVTAPDNSQHIRYQIQPRPGSAEAAGPIISLPLPIQTRFVLESGVPDTPMGFGLCSGMPVCIGNVNGGPPIMEFTSTGTFTDASLTPLNGTIFVGIPGQPTSARAVTVMGGTGRVRSYSYIGSSGGGWIE